VNDKKQEKAPVEGLVMAADLVDLKRDMQSAKIIAWLQYNQQQLIAGAVILVLLLVGYSLWQEQQRTQKESAALMYIKATNTADAEQRDGLLDSVIKDYAGTGYATLAVLQKSKDGEARKAALETLLLNKGAPEVVWQASLDLAEIHIAEGRNDEAKTLLDVHFGKHFEQPRYYLLSRIAMDADEKMMLIQKSLDAESHDNDLLVELEAELALLKASK
jgi:predicted negative regulator of RcsB-dependent stress response